MMSDSFSDAKLRVLEVAGELFMERGYEAVKLKDIAEKLEIKQPSLYYHFEDGKEEIYVEVVKKELKRLNAGLLEVILNDSNDFKKTMYGIGNWAKDNMAMSPVIMNKVDLPQISQTNREKLQFLLLTMIFNPMKEMFERAKNMGVIKDWDTSVLTGMILSLLEGMDDRINMGPNKIEAWNKLVNILLEGMLS